MDKFKLLIVDDEEEIIEVLTILLEGEGFETVSATNGQAALNLLNDDIDLIIMDIMMPEMSGYKLCAKVREKYDTPILFLTAKNQDSDLTMGFSAGGDDYVSKPFSYSELIARIKGLLRRYNVYKENTKFVRERFIESRGIKINVNSNEVYKNGQELNLTYTEYKILALLFSYIGKIFSISNIYESVWEEPYYLSSGNTVVVHIKKLREKIEDDPQNPKIIRTVWGKGYRVE